MAARFLAEKLATVNLSRISVGDLSGHFLRQTTARISGSYGFSTANRRPEGTEAVRDRPYDQQGEDRSTRSYVSDKAKEGAKKATEAVVNIGDTLKETADGVWKAAKKTSQSISEAVAKNDAGGGGNWIQEDRTAAKVKEVNQPVDTTEYKGVEELQDKAGGYDKVDSP